MSARILITGSRSWTPDPLYVRMVLDGLVRKHGDIVVAHGDCPTGVDAAFESACQIAGITTERHPARWSEHGRSAGPRRNGEMCRFGAVVCLAFHPTLDQKSGTADCTRQALKAGIPTFWIPNENVKPIRQGVPVKPMRTRSFLED